MVTQQPGGPDIPKYQAAPSLEVFLGSTVDLIPQLAQAMRALTKDPADHVIIAAYELPLTIQVASLRDYLLGLAADASAPLLAEVEARLQRMAAIPLTQSAMRVVENLGTPTTKIAFGDLFEMIKKVIRALLDIFNIDLGDWFNKLLDLIEEILAFLLSLGLVRLTRTLIERQGFTWETLAKVEYLEIANAQRRRDALGV